MAEAGKRQKTNDKRQKTKESRKQEQPEFDPAPAGGNYSRPVGKMMGLCDRVFNSQFPIPDQFVKIRAVPAFGVPARLWHGNSWTNKEKIKKRELRGLLLSVASVFPVARLSIPNSGFLSGYTPPAVNSDFRTGHIIISDQK